MRSVYRNVYMTLYAVSSIKVNNVNSGENKGGFSEASHVNWLCCVRLVFNHVTSSDC